MFPAFEKIRCRDFFALYKITGFLFSDTITLQEQTHWLFT